MIYNSVGRGRDKDQTKFNKFISSRLVWFSQNLQVKDSKQLVTLFYDYDERKVNAITWPYNLEIKKKNFIKFLAHLLQSLPSQRDSPRFIITSSSSL